MRKRYMRVLVLSGLFLSSGFVGNSYADAKSNLLLNELIQQVKTLNTTTTQTQTTLQQMNTNVSNNQNLLKLNLQGWQNYFTLVKKDRFSKHAIGFFSLYFNMPSVNQLANNSNAFSLPVLPQLVQMNPTLSKVAGSKNAITLIGNIEGSLGVSNSSGQQNNQLLSSIVSAPFQSSSLDGNSASTLAASLAVATPIQTQRLIAMELALNNYISVQQLVATQNNSLMLASILHQQLVTNSELNALQASYNENMVDLKRTLAVSLNKLTSAINRLSQSQRGR